MSWRFLSRLSLHIASFLAGAGLLGGIFSTGHAEAGFRKAPENYKDVEVRTVQSGPMLLFSDSPEMVYENGILYKDTVEGEGRVFFHHVNATKKNKKLAILMRPLHKMTTITWGCRGIGDPDKSYYISAIKGQQRYFSDYKEYWHKALKNNKKEKSGKALKKGNGRDMVPDYSFYGKVEGLPVTTLALGEHVEILSKERSMEHSGVRLKPEQLLTGMFDFHADRPVEVVIMMCSPEDDVNQFSVSGKVLPMDVHPLRGTYQNADLTYVVKEPLQMKWYQAKALCLGGSDDTMFLKGKDVLSDTETMNYGNYGVVYHILYSVAGEHPVRLGINPWGGDFNGAAMQISGDKTEFSKIPHKDLYFGSGEELDDIFMISPDHKRKDAEFIWSPPGASNLPIRVFWTVKRL